MNWKKVFTIAALTGFSASVATGQGTAPTIVQGDYISNVFGNSNFIKNPNAKLNTKDVTVSSATVTRSTTTPLVATSEFNITTSTSTGYADWSLRAFDAGMKNNNCEARFTYRGFTVGSTKAQILQGTNVVAELTLIGDANNPKQASINFPCGDLSAVTKFRLQQATASLTGTNEIGGIYVGLATNMANVAQAEIVVSAYKDSAQSIGGGATTIVYNQETYDQYGEFDTTTGIFTAKRAGRYEINGSLLWDTTSFASGVTTELMVLKNGNGVAHGFETQQNTMSRYWQMRVNGVIDLAVGNTLELRAYQTSGTNKNVFVSVGSTIYNQFIIKRFPSSSELVVTPERQNVFGGVKITSSGHDSNAVTSASYTLLQASGAASPVVTTRTIFGKAKSESTNDYILSIDNMPVGNFQVQVSGTMYVQSSGVAGNATQCRFAVADSSTGGAQIGGTSQEAAGDASITTQFAIASSFHGVYQNTAVGNKTFYVQAARGSGNGSCKVYIDSTRPLTISVIPLDQPSNSALYVQGPVKAAETGAAIPAGYVGEVKQSTIGITNITASAYTNLNTVTLTNGAWLCSTQATFWRNAATVPTNFEFLTCVADSASGSCNIGYNLQTSGSSYAAGILNTFTYLQISSMPTVVRYDGTKFTFAEGTTSTSATGILAQKVYLDASAGTPRAQGRLECVRIN